VGTIGVNQIEPWDESEYLESLNHDRHMFAWCLVTFGNVPEPIARSRAEAFYPYESAAAERRGLVLHDDAWHWAMLQILGEQYWWERPELEHPSADYQAEAERYQALKMC
jgi:hypothetical protein